MRFESGCNTGRIASSRHDIVRLHFNKGRAGAPQSGSHVSESNYFNPDWPTEYWGTTYTRLLAVKAKYDPDGLFLVHNGVGTEGWSRDGFSRLG